MIEVCVRAAKLAAPPCDLRIVCCFCFIFLLTIELCANVRVAVVIFLLDVAFIVVTVSCEYFKCGLTFFVMRDRERSFDVAVGCGFCKTRALKF